MHMLLWQRVKLYSVLIQKIIVKFEFETLYEQFRNDPVGRRKVSFSESDEVTTLLQRM